VLLFIVAYSQLLVVLICLNPNSLGLFEIIVPFTKLPGPADSLLMNLDGFRLELQFVNPYGKLLEFSVVDKVAFCEQRVVSQPGFFLLLFEVFPFFLGEFFGELSDTLGNVRFFLEGGWNLG